MSGKMIKNWQLPFTVDDKAVAADDYLAALSLANTGFYPMGSNNLWHGGIHLSNNVIEVLGGEILGCIADGEVIAYRIDEKYPQVDYGEFKATFSSGFVLVRHVLEIPKSPKATATETTAAEEKVGTQEETKAIDETDTPEENDSANENNKENTSTTSDNTQAETVNEAGNSEKSTIPDLVHSTFEPPASTRANKPPQMTNDARQSSTSSSVVGENKNTLTESEAKTNETKSVKAENTSDSQQSTEAASDKIASPTVLNLYSLYMHLSDWASYNADKNLVRPAYWQSNEYCVGDKAKDSMLGCVVRQNGAGTKVLALLPRGTQIKVGEPIKMGSLWHKLESIESGQSLPVLTAPLSGYVFVGEMTRSPDDKACYTVEHRGNDKSDLALGLNVRATPNGKWLSCLPKGTKLSIVERGGKNNNWGRIGSILDGRACPALPVDNEGQIQGWVYLSLLDFSPAKPMKVDEVIILDTPCSVKAGELIGYPGQDQGISDALSFIPPTTLTHIELFTCDDLPALIKQSRKQWKNSDEEHKPYVVINKRATLHKPVLPDYRIEAQVELEKVANSKSQGAWVEVREKAKVYSLIVARSQLGKRIKPDKTHYYGGYHVSYTQKDTLLLMLRELGIQLTRQNIPDTIQFDGLYYHDSNDSKTKPYKKGVEVAPAGYNRRNISFSIMQETPTFWVNNNVLNEAGSRTDLTLTLNGWRRYPLQKGQNVVDKKTGFNCFIADKAKSKEYEENNPHKTVTDSEGKRWYYVEGIDEQGMHIEGWAKEETPDVMRYAAWEWPLFELIQETATPQQQVDRMNRGVMLDEADRTPLMQTLYDVIDVNKDKVLTPSELQQALKKPWLATQLSRLAVNYESEWYADKSLSKWNELDSWLTDVYWKEASEEDKAKYLGYWQKEKTERIKKLLWWDELAGKHGLSKDGKAWYFHPAGMVGNFGKIIRKVNVAYNSVIQVTRWKSYYGPVHWGTTKLADTPLWDELIRNGYISLDEKEIIAAMTENEGKIESVQSYDSEIITAGAMQKTINSSGTGEFPLQVKRFKEKNFILYKELFEDKGWYIEENAKVVKMYYQHQDWENGIKLEGRALKDNIRKDCNEKTFRQKIKCPLVSIIVLAISNEEYIKLQITDYVDRLRSALNKYPVNYSFKLVQLFKTKLGRALVLDQDVNRPAYVADDVRKALDKFFKDNISVSKDISNWGNNHSQYENEIIENYGSFRRMTDSKKRFNELKSRL